MKIIIIKEQILCWVVITIPYFGHVLATKMLVENRLPVMFMYREKPDSKNDSGWRFFCGKESQDYVDNPENIGIYNVNTIIGIDNNIVPYLLSDTCKAFERVEGTKEFREVEFTFGVEDKNG